MAKRTTYGKKFRTRRGRYGCYKYVNGRRVGFVTRAGKRRGRYQTSAWGSRGKWSGKTWRRSRR